VGEIVSVRQSLRHVKNVEENVNVPHIIVLVDISIL
jgi:hypothetical protein